ncbi:Zinc finger protein 827-like 2 [Homarus americanus]|uniref:Zinc finger protein 827-like 2 n=1 Tax=Homarus americanus TaxID=6706 RepID=A0A8J5K389_HOMAM|nr:Zinc finger protein 827-like 2 [Homarus americanus]
MQKWEDGPCGGVERARCGRLRKVLFVLQEAAHGAAEGVATRMLACPMCTKVFHGTKRKYRLDRHMLVHWGLKPFKCPHCPYRSTQQNNLNRHMKNVHFQIIGPMQESGVTLQANSAISNRPGLLHHEGSQDLNEDYLQEAERNVEGPVSCGTLSHHSDNHVEQDAGIHKTM